MCIDDEIGMDWWNALSDQGRAKWASLAGTGRAKDAWELYKASTEMQMTFRSLLVVGEHGKPSRAA
jgi:hypothetical protein